MVILRLSKTVTLCLALVYLASAGVAASPTRIYAQGEYDLTTGYGIDSYGRYDWLDATGNRLYVTRIYGSDGSIVSEADAYVGIQLSSLFGSPIGGYRFSFNVFSIYATNVRVSVWDGSVDTFLTDLTNPGGWVTIDVTPEIRNALSAGETWANFAFTNGYGEFAAAEDPQGRGSFLEITPIPEPSSLPALLAGVSGLGGMLIRRRK